MTQTTAITASPEEANVPACRHHWVIQPAMGPVSEGFCQVCGELREFKNYVESSSWGEEKPVLRSSAKSPPVLARAVADYLDSADEQ